MNKTKKPGDGGIKLVNPSCLPVFVQQGLEPKTNRERERGWVRQSCIHGEKLKVKYLTVLLK